MKKSKKAMREFENRLDEQMRAENYVEMTNRPVTERRLNETAVKSYEREMRAIGKKLGWPEPVAAPAVDESYKLDNQFLQSARQEIKGILRSLDSVEALQARRVAEKEADQQTFQLRMYKDAVAKQEEAEKLQKAMIKMAFTSILPDAIAAAKEMYPNNGDDATVPETESTNTLRNK